MTEKEAETTRCCGPDGCGAAISIASNDRYCIGSSCMGWRWVPAPLNGSLTVPDPTDGYCGLAGKP